MNVKPKCSQNFFLVKIACVQFSIHFFCVVMFFHPLGLFLPWQFCLACLQNYLLSIRVGMLVQNQIIIISLAWLNCNVQFHQKMVRTTLSLSVCSHLMPKDKGNTKHHEVQNWRENAFQTFDVLYSIDM